MVISKEKQRRLKEKADDDRKVRESQEKEQEKISKAKGDAENEAAAEKNKADAQVEKKKPKAPEKKTRFVRRDNVEARKRDGWEVVEQPVNEHERTLGVKGESDLVLMEK